jgi:hypothetical protein
MEEPAEPSARLMPLIEDTELSGLVMPDDEYNELLRVVGMYRRQAEKCASAGAYLAGCIMIGAALEGALMAICNCYYDDIPDDLKPQDKKKPLPFIKWGFFDLLDIARKLKWLPSGLNHGEEWSNKKADIGDYAEWVLRLRNLVHPARYVQDMPRRHVTERYYRSCEETFGSSIDYLVAKIGQSLEDAHDRGEL